MKRLKLHPLDAAAGPADCPHWRNAVETGNLLIDLYNTGSPACLRLEDLIGAAENRRHYLQRQIRHGRPDEGKFVRSPLPRRDRAAVSDAFDRSAEVLELYDGLMREIASMSAETITPSGFEGL